MNAQVILTVGNSMMGDDGAGPLLADLFAKSPVEAWTLIDGGSSPENVVHAVLALSPSRVVIVDAAEMGLRTGELRRIDAEQITALFIMSTHNLPLNFLMARLHEQVPEVIFIGVQPDLVAFHCPMTPAVRTAIESLHTQLANGWDPASCEILASSFSH